MGGIFIAQRHPKAALAKTSRARCVDKNQPPLIDVSLSERVVDRQSLVASGAGVGRVSEIERAAGRSGSEREGQVCWGAVQIDRLQTDACDAVGIDHHLFRRE